MNKIMLFFFLNVVFLTCNNKSETQNSGNEESLGIIFFENTESKSSDRVEYNFYKALKELKDVVDFKIVIDNSEKGVSSDEVKKELCIYNIDEDIFFKYVECTNYLNNYSNCERIIEKSDVVDTYHKCLKLKKYQDYYNSQKKYQEINYERRYPLIIINNVYYDGSFRKDDYVRYICKKTGLNNDVCKKIKPQQTQYLNVLTHKSCENCIPYSNAVITMLNNLYNNKIDVKYLDYEGTEGFKMYENIRRYVKYLPALCFTSSVRNDDLFFWMEMHLVKVGNYYCMKDSVPNFDPEKQENNM